MITHTHLFTHSLTHSLTLARARVSRIPLQLLANRQSHHHRCPPHYDSHHIGAHSSLALAQQVIGCVVSISGPGGVSGNLTFTQKVAGRYVGPSHGLLRTSTSPIGRSQPPHTCTTQSCTRSPKGGRDVCVCVCVCVCVWVGGKVGGWVWVCMCQVGVKCVSIQNMNEPAASPLIPARHKAVHARSGAALALSTDSHVTRSTAVGTKHSSTCPHLASPWSLEAVVASARPSPLAELRQVAEVPARQKAVRTYQMAI
jgi:hypothetical protein